MATASNNPASNSTKEESTSIVGMALRLFWMFLGTVGLAGCLLAILQGRQTLSSWVDILYWGLVPAMIAARYVDIKRFEGANAYGQPSTMRDWRRYALTLAATAAIGWFLAHGIAYLFMR